MTWPRATIADHLLPRWLEARCDLGQSLFDRAGALYDSWREYAHGCEAEPGSPAEFAAAMEARGFECDQLRGDRCRIRWGLRLRQLPTIRRGDGKSSAAAVVPAPPPPSFGDFFRENGSFEPKTVDREPLSCGENGAAVAAAPQKKNQTILAEGVVEGFATALRRAWPVDLSGELPPTIIFEGNKR